MRKPCHNRYFYLAAVLAITLITRPSVAHQLYSSGGQNFRWAGNSLTFRYHPTQFTGEWLTGLQETIDLWNESPANFTLAITPDNNTAAHGNGENEIWFGQSSTAYCQNYYDYVNNRVIESDVVFGTSTNWVTSEIKGDLLRYGGSGRPFQNTALHEIGHAIPLAHENRVYNIMGMDFEFLSVNGDFVRTYVGEDAAAGAVALYGSKAGPLEDISVSHWAYAGTAGEYSDHRRTRIYNAAGQPLLSTSVNEEPVFNVSRGQAVNVEFTFENNGLTDHQNVAVGYYLSSDSTISTLDTRIAVSQRNFVRDTPDTERIAITIPSQTVPGTYWLGVIADETDALSEIVETNNATYIQIRVVP